MGINELYKVITDIDFQANRLLKSKPISIDYLIQFDKLVEEVRPEIIKMDLSDEINTSFKELERIDFELVPYLRFNLSSIYKIVLRNNDLRTRLLKIYLRCYSVVSG